MQTGLEVSRHSKADNLAQALELIDTTPAEIMVFPEMWPIGYSSFERYAADAEPLDGPLVRALQKAARNKGCWLVPGSFPELLDDKLNNTTMLIDPEGDIKGVYRKIHVFSYQSKEKEIVSPGAQPVVIDTPFGKVGLAVCYDLRFPELFRYMARQGAEIFFVVASWPSARKRAWELFATARAHENMAWCVACNSHADSMVIAPTGNVLACASAHPETLIVNLDLKLVGQTRAEFPVLNDAHWTF